MNPYNITFVGAGNLASALCMVLYKAGHRIEKIMSEGGISASVLAALCGSVGSADLTVPDNTDLVIMAVPDHKIGYVSENLKCNNRIPVVHTSGTTALDVFKGKFLHTGVLYPLQTFSKGRVIDLNEVPVFIEASDYKTETIIKSVAGTVSKTVYVADEKVRREVHLAAVFVSNFTNNLITEGKHIAEKAGYNFEILIPLLNETIRKAIADGPENSQTGPARRGDLNTIEKHLDLLSFSPELKVIYKVMSDSIIKRYRG